MDEQPSPDRQKARTGFRSVTVELVRDDAPPPVRAEAARVRELITLQHELTRKPVVLVPVLVASGQISRQKLPRDIEGLPIAYFGRGAAAACGHGALGGGAGRAARFHLLSEVDFARLGGDYPAPADRAG
jgi:hypothetical protein